MFFHAKILNLEEFKKKLAKNGIDTRVYPDHMQFIFPDASKFEISIPDKTSILIFSGEKILHKEEDT